MHITVKQGIDKESLLMSAKNVLCIMETGLERKNKDECTREGFGRDKRLKEKAE